jgi:glucose-1-phosphate cytidylyltransferase
MKVVILAGGVGARLSEETAHRPKPLVEIGGMPILLHIMKLYSSHGFCDFLIAGGYKVEQLEQFACGLNRSEWTCQVVDTGPHSMTGGRLLRLADHLRGGAFMVTYGDGVADLDLGALLAFHRRHGRLATVTAVRPPARFGKLEIAEDDRVSAFREKWSLDEPVINGGFFVFESGVLDFLQDDSTVLESEPLTQLAERGELYAFRHSGFWRPMDTLRDKRELDALWAAGDAPWKR